MSRLERLEREYRAAAEAQLERLEKETRDMAKEHRETMERWMDEARSVSRDSIYRITVLSASIVAFSATLLSIEQLDLNANETLLAVSWCLFAAVVVLGPASVLLEARAKYVVAHRATLPQDYDLERSPRVMERLKLYAVLAYSVVIRPRNLVYVRDTDYDAKTPTQGMWMNFRVIQALHNVWDVALGLELLVWTLFAAATIALVVSLFP
jgi:hypothetical protein